MRAFGSFALNISSCKLSHYSSRRLNIKQSSSAQNSYVYLSSAGDTADAKTELSLATTQLPSALMTSTTWRQWMTPLRMTLVAASQATLLSTSLSRTCSAGVITRSLCTPSMPVLLSR